MDFRDLRRYVHTVAELILNWVLAYRVFRTRMFLCPGGPI